MAESDLIRGNVDTIILKVLYEGDRYGYDLIKQINSRGDGQWEIKQPTVYACLKRLEKQGFISSYWGTSESDGGRRKYYSLTDSGKEVFLKYKNEFERASALFGGLISGNESMFMADDYSDVEDETYTVSKRPRPRKPKLKTEQPANIVSQHDEVDPDAYSVTYTENAPEEMAEQPATVAEEDTAEQSVNEENIDDTTELAEQTSDNNSDGAVILDESETATLPEVKDDDVDDDEQYFNDLIALAKSLSHSEEELEAEHNSDQLTKTDEKSVYDVPPARETIDPKAIIDSYYATERGESYSDVHAKTTYTEQPPATTVINTAPAVKPVAQAQPAPVPPRESAPAPTIQPVQPKPQPTPTVSTIGFPDPDESQARKEYKTVLTDLVERLEIAAPAVRDEQAEQAAAADKAEPAHVLSDEDKQFGKIKDTVRDLGNDVQVTAHNDSAKQYAHKYYYYSNRLLMTHDTIMCVAMFLVGLTLFLTFYLGLKLRMPYDYLLYIAAGLLPIIMFIITVIRYAGNPDKRKRINLNMGFSLFIRCIIMLQVAVVIYCVNLIWGMPVGFSYGYLPSLIIPVAYALFIPISKVIFWSLLKSGSYSVGR